ncbi:MAG TPA: response regulator transcription factor [Nocardiopsis listeri]|uniref:response regulator transcription factor n=1 Tax=Nocardiopsis listeri TaxID=53440 RepID=UPI001DC73ED4|nr:response regulator transcription factor [Nocardiopsis listeri]HJE59677.1 response regulator transcription factor [Nocardiopsis listeri]
MRRGNGELILVVARDPEVVDVLCPTLELAGYGVDVTATGEAAIDRMGRGGLDLILVDTTLPDLSEIPRRRRGVGGPPVLFMVNGEFLDTVLPEVGLSGEDYVAEPVRVPELLARVWLLIRGRGARRSEPLLRYGDLTLDDTSCRARRGGRELDLTPAEYRLLRYLLVNSGRVLSKEHIADHLWGELRADNAIERLISRLRRKVEGDGPNLIRTHRGFGYALEGRDR